MTAYKVQKDVLSDLRKVCRNGQKSVDRLERKIGDARVLKTYVEMGRFAIEEPFEPFLVAEISVYGQPDKRTVKLEAD